MKKILLFLCIPFIGFTQDYQLDFNSANMDYVEMYNASSVIANKTAFSISGWVNPQSDVSHSGFFGFRNNTDADFYLLQLTNTNNIEARFRNSSGIAYDIIANNALDFNQWQHLVLTYDGSYICLYKDGSLVDSTAANGIIAQNFDSFKLGALDYQGTLFHMIGNLDEIRLWDVALSANEINNWMCVEVDSTHPNYVNLMGYWNLNEGIGSYTDDQTANGNNGTLFGGTTWQASSSCLSGAILCGDVNEDGVVDQTDATEINNFILGSPPLVFNSWAADVNCDGTINILDITMLNSFISSTGSLNCCSTTTPQTYVPDNNFENYLEANGMGDGIALNDYVYTSAIDTITTLPVSNLFISDLTGVEDMVSLEILNCHYNQLTSLDISNNLNLVTIYCHGNLITTLNISGLQLITELYCSNNQITSLDISNLSGLKFFSCLDNQLTSLDVSNNDSLIDLNCSSNLINSLSLTNNTILFSLQCYNNLLTSLDVRNGNNQNINEFKTAFNPQLYCIDVDDDVWSTSIWTSGWGNIDAQHYFSTNCSGTGIEESPTNKDLLRKIDVLGRETKGTKDELLIYIYDDETVEKKIIIE